ncbi:hypothetical protein BAE44_0010312, partial [Dichanthelium oligosanthes]
LIVTDVSQQLYRENFAKSYSPKFIYPTRCSGQKYKQTPAVYSLDHLQPRTISNLVV